MVRWLEVGWGGSPPYFISHSDAYHTAPAHLLFVFCLSLLFLVDMGFVLTKLLRAKYGAAEKDMSDFVWCVTEPGMT